MIQKDLEKKKRDPLTQDRVHKHLSDEKDVITEEDIKNAKTDVASLVENMEEEESPQKDDKENNGDPADKKVKNNTDPDIETPWNILSA